VRSDWKLTTAEKKRVLLNNIFGVDIDQQAVEVTKLSLLLKVLEEENQETVSKQLTITAERALPSLDHNIKCGNSLIGWDILTPEMPADEVKRINPFDWSKEFESIMVAGGFDAVIGNPPYVRQEGLKEQKKYFETHYAVYQGTADLYAYFIEKGISLLRPKGHFAYIVANKWMKANYGKPLRKYLLTKQIDGIIDFGSLPVFKTATIYPCILMASNEMPVREFFASRVTALDFSSLDEYIIKNCHPISPTTLTDDGWTLENEQIQNVLNKIQKSGNTLEEFVQGKIFYGIKTGLNDAFIIDEETKNKFIEEDPKNAKIIKPFLIGKDIKRYRELKSNKYLIYLPWHFPLHEDKTITGASKNAEMEFKNNYPVIFQYISRFKTELKQRNLAETDISYEWYALQRFGASYYKEFEKKKILWPGISSQITAFSLDENAFFGNDNIQMIISDDKYLLGILNSKISRVFLAGICDVVQGGFYRLKITYISKIPIRTIDFSDPADKARHDRMVALVTQMLDLNKKLQDARLEQERTMLSRQIGATDGAIDKLVYELYGLTEEEIAVVEGVKKPT
jgi:hypothetical protein